MAFKSAMDESTERSLELNDETVARFLFGDNAQTGTIRLMIWIAGFVLVFGGLFILLR